MRGARQCWARITFSLPTKPVRYRMGTKADASADTERWNPAFLRLLENRDAGNTQQFCWAHGFGTVGPIGSGVGSALWASAEQVRKPMAVEVFAPRRLT